MTGDPSSEFFQLDHVYKRFDRNVALRDVTLSIGAGEAVALLGANGAGKTTLLRTLATLGRPTRGRILAFGVDAWSNKVEVRRRIGIVGHQPYVYPELSCRENLHFFARMYGIDRRDERVTIALDRVGLANRQADRASGLSRGLLQRLNLARALLHDPAVLVLDEPDTGLDARGRSVLESVITDQRERGGSVIFTSHQLDFAMRLASRVLVIEDGQVSIDASHELVSPGDVMRMLSAEPVRPSR